MPSRPTVPDTALAAVRRYCANKVPVQHRHELRVECGLRGTSITIYECRPPWHPNLGPDWSRQPVAQLRYEAADHHWRLYCADRNSRWHYYDMAEPTPQLSDLLDEIDEDPTGIFWGSAYDRSRPEVTSPPRGGASSATVAGTEGNSRAR